MIDARARARFDRAKVDRKKTQGTIRSLAHAAATLRLAVRRMVRVRKTPRPPGQPASSPTRQLRESIRYALDERRRSAVVGPSREDVDVIGRVHEYGGSFRGRVYPARPFMAPAFAAIAPRIAAHWRGRIH